MGQLFDELKRRNVFRVGVAYVVSAWLVLQVADVVLNNISAPDWVFSVFMLTGAVFFVPVLVFSWAYELTPDGLKKESEVDRSGSITGQTGRKLNLITMGMLVAVVAFVLIERTLEPGMSKTADGIAEETESGEVTTTTVDDKSIAVLAFDDLSPGGDQAFFAEGLSEEILNVLAQVPGLKVAGRTSSFAFKDQDTDLREIGEALNVAHILEGSVRKAGDRIRVTAQLIQASDGFHLFSKTYDRDLVDVFAVQDDLAALIGNALQAELTGDDAIPSVKATSMDVYDTYLLARQRIRTRSPELMTEAMSMLDEALLVDPNYAPALAQRALAVHLMSDSPGAYGDIPEAVAGAEARQLLKRAIEIDPQLAEAHAVLGLVETDQSSVSEVALASLRHALELNPNMDDGRVWLANATYDPVESMRLYEAVVVRDPLHGPAFNNLIQGYMQMGDFDKSEALIDRVERITGPTDSIAQARGTIGFMNGDLSASVTNLRQSFESNPNSNVVKLWYGYALLGVGEMEQAIVGADLSVSVVAHWLSGDTEAADALIAEKDFSEGRRSRWLRHASDYLADRGREAELIAIVERFYGDVKTVISELPVSNSYGTEYLGSMAYAYLQAGRQEEFELLLERMEAVLAEEEANKGFNWYFWYSKSQYAALTGNAEAATSYMQEAYDAGLTAVVFIEPLFGLLDEDAAFQAVKAKIIERGNRERADLGLDPYRPVLGI
ncbi:MAG: hypothetical protein GWP62_05265 [Gammaproteobacteria bacterium]|nr:hypothetical protein [Gammaproteobacteria bacterium]